jgi:hypothetical protein
VIAPGDSGQVEVSLNTKSKKGPTKKFIQVHSNDPLNKVTRLYITATIIPKKQDKP